MAYLLPSRPQLGCVGLKVHSVQVVEGLGPRFVQVRGLLARGVEGVIPRFV